MKMDKKFSYVPLFLQWVLNILLTLLALILSVFLVKETFTIYQIIFNLDGTPAIDLLESILNFFLYFEFIALIIKYFEAHFHFPLRYFIYIGITAIVRLIIVDHKDPMDTILYSGAILVMVVTLFIADLRKKSSN
ncbi:phosphate-starvation-inducible protein PsiE [Paenibacillus sp. P96]|uniref:Protein PsiE homolog n=1 Tax=Paenibacillus zeirhizosphaerae TaxID=2987519 RepID=A0ABT9FST1_9BACL|nr:phosphate-starvation-inducible protein PsiE [Paenibacillus sp. P96]MDP4097556.1 phosphate-starvation-inducible protein PsiE [Paenibacillus sp. P96]